MCVIGSNGVCILMLLRFVHVVVTRLCRHTFGEGSSCLGLGCPAVSCIQKMAKEQSHSQQGGAANYDLKSFCDLKEFAFYRLSTPENFLFSPSDWIVFVENTTAVSSTTFIRRIASHNLKM